MNPETAESLIAYQCHGTNVGEAGTLRGGNGGLTGGVPFVAAALASRYHKGTDSDATDALVVSALTSEPGGPDVKHAQAGHLVAQTVALRGREGGATAELGGEQATALRASQGGGDKPHVLALDWQQAGGVTDDHTATLSVTRTQADGLRAGVRRLTPVECERLMGWPDGWTAGQPDSTRYRQCGNGVVGPVAEWIAQRIVQVTP